MTSPGSGVGTLTSVVEQDVQVIVPGCDPRLADHRQFLVRQLLDTSRPRGIAADALKLLRREQYQAITAVSRDGDRLAQRLVAHGAIAL